MAQAGDLVITADIPLAAAALAKGAHVLDPRGEWMNAENIEERLSIRAMMDQLRSSGVQTGGLPPYARAMARSSRANWTDFFAKRSATK